MKKIWIIGILILIALIPVTSAIYVPSNTDNITLEKLVTEPLNNDEKEIITKIDGSCLDTSFYGIGVFYNVEIWATHETWFQIIAYTSLLPPRSYTVQTGKYFKAPIFIGYTFYSSYPRQTVRGIALGDIEWN